MAKEEMKKSIKRKIEKQLKSAIQQKQLKSAIQQKQLKSDTKHSALNNQSDMEQSELKLETKRQIFHLVLGIIAVLLIYYNIIDAVKIFVVLLAGIALSLLSRKFRIPGMYWLLKQFGREDEIQKFPGRGAIFFCAGVLLAVKLFPKDIALASIMVLAVGDSVSHLVGRRFGRTKNPITANGKHLEGTIAGIIAGFFGALIFVGPLEAILAAAGAMIAESIDFDLNKQHVDDNIIVPLVAGTVIYVMRIYF